MKNIPSSLFRLIGGLIVMFLMYSCSSSFYLSTMHHDPIYGPEEVVLTLPSDTKIDTIDSEWALHRKLRKDFNFRWDFATYASNQPYSWYFSNRMFNRYSFYNPYSRFDMYMNSHNFWFDWAFNYPFNNFGYNWRDPYGINNYYSRWNSWGMYGYGWNNYGYGYNNWYNGPWNNNGYNAVWNSSRENTMISYNRGRRGSNNVSDGTNSNIQNNIIVNRNKPRRITNNDDNIEVDKRWNLDEWQRRHGLISRLVAKEYMKLQSNHEDIDLLSEYEKIYNRISKNS